MNRYEVDGTLEGRTIRLKGPIPCKEGPVKVIVTPQTERVDLEGRNRRALEALDRLLAEPDDLSPEKWLELEKTIEDHPLSIRKSVV